MTTGPNNSHETKSGTEQLETVAAFKVKRPLWKKILIAFTGLSLVGIVMVGALILWAILHYGRDLPDYRQLASYEPAVVTRIHAGDGQLMQEYATERRLFVPYEVLPQRLVDAFVAAEDKSFFEHSGLDYFGMLRAQARNVLNLMRGRRLQGGSTITQQVARNFLLTLDQRVDRKIKEMILTLRIERAYSKERILELYLNEINFGNRSYGIAAASLNYFNKSLSELTTAEMAYLAALPKGPNNYHPVRHKKRAMARRDYVLARMHVLGFINDKTYEAALSEDLIMRPRTGINEFKAEYFAEEVRRRVLSRYGKKTLYEGGLSVRTSLEPRLQAIAERTLRDGLVAYDRRHGWRGSFGTLSTDGDWVTRLLGVRRALGYKNWKLALVHEVREDGAIVGLKDGSYGFIPFEEVTWARRWRPRERLGPKVTDMAQVLRMGEVVAVEERRQKPGHEVIDFFDVEGESIGLIRTYALRQRPDINGAIVAMDPHTGRVLAMSGGFDYKASQYNRATQAERQPGSAFKPFVYAAALDNGFTPASLVLDAPFVIDQGEGETKWKPKNSTNKFYGPSTLRLGIEKSRNLMTVRLAQNIGMRRVMNYAKEFGLEDNMEPTLAASLGAGEVTLLNLTAAYGMLINGGKRIKPSLIDRIADRRGDTIYKHDERDCFDCGLSDWFEGKSEPDVEDIRAQVIGSLTAYQLVTMMQGVVDNGTGRKIRVIGKPLAGKTGTTNDNKDAWFVGFSPDMVVGVLTGFDRPRYLGYNEEGSAVAVPIFRDFMNEALKGTPGTPFRMPSGIRLVRINAETGQPARKGDKRIILEAFKPGTEPRFGQVAVLDGSLPLAKSESVIRKGTGGIY